MLNFSYFRFAAIHQVFCKLTLTLFTSFGYCTDLHLFLVSRNSWNNLKLLNRCYERFSSLIRLLKVVQLECTSIKLLDIKKSKKKNYFGSKIWKHRRAAAPILQNKF